MHGTWGLLQGSRDVVIMVTLGHYNRVYIGVIQGNGKECGNYYSNKRVYIEVT